MPTVVPPDTQIGDFFVNNYRQWLVPYVGDERATLLAGPDISDQVTRITGFYNNALNTIDNLNPASIDSAISNILPPDFSSLLGQFPP